MEDLTGKQFGRYQITAPLGEGGMAAVYKAYQPAMERSVAIKVLPRHMASSDEFVARFEREAKLLAQLQHPHILPVFDYGESDGYTYIVMPFVQSGTLADLMKKGHLSLNEIRRIMTQIGDALAYAHTRGMIHRDIKPSNVLIDERGNCLLTDFGLARMAEASSNLTSSGAVMGTPAYMAPEQGSGSSIDNRSDLYALGVIFYELTTGRVPYTAETPIAIVFKHISDPLPSARKINPDLDEAIELVLYKALAKNPDDRYQTAEDFVRAVQSAIPDKPAEHESANMVQAESKTVPPVSQVAKSTSTLQPGTDSRKTTRTSKTSTAVIIGMVGLIGIIMVCAIAIVGFRIRQAKNHRVVSSTATNAPEIAVPVSTSTLTSTPLPQPATEIPAPVGEKFTDDFNGQLSDGWDWVAEDPATWSLSEAPGFLQIIASDASLDGSASPTNILFRYTGAESFEATTLVRFKPTSDYQFAGIIIFQDGNNALQFGRAFCDNPDACVGDGLYFDSFTDSEIGNDNFKTAINGDEVYLRLRRAGNLYTADYSMDGKNWIKVGEHEREFTTVNIGLIAAQASTPIPAQFDYFTLKESP